MTATADGSPRSSAPVVAEHRTPFERFLELSRQQAEVSVFETGARVRDGLELAADVYLPRDQHVPAPTILSVTPYGKDDAALVAEARFYQDHGYAFVAVDCRGRGKSEGDWKPIVHDPDDTHDVIEWAAAQPWSSGKIGTTGLSYLGWVQWAGASQSPAHLTCMVSTSAAGRWQQEIPYTNGVLQLYFAWWVYIVRRRITENHGLATLDWDAVLATLPIDDINGVIDPAGSPWETLVGHDRLDGQWTALRFDGHYDAIDVPCLHVTGWYDLEDLLGAFHHYEHMMTESPARDRQQLLVGPWSHGKSRHPHSSYADVFFGDHAAVDMDAIHLRWFDHHLKGIDNGVESDAPVRVFEPGTNEWRTAPAWPLSNAEDVLYLSTGDGSGVLVPAPPPGPDRPRSYRYDPLDPVPTGLDIRRYGIDDVPLDQTANEARADVLSYTGAILETALTVSGWATLELLASSDRDDTDWHVKITDVAPDGRSDKVTQGCLRASYRDSLAEPTPLEPGVPTLFGIELWPTHHRFLPGHRVRVTVTSSDFPWFARSMNTAGPIGGLAEPRTATNTVHHGGLTPSRLVLPVEQP